ncbi:MarR family winged helix-turn-helix transcriptional regulator [Parerythrobacter aestuarii]|uniref:MarR family winged helix-turn-helix transcriptional regulator n=1 Tax=Parerythrobacter aestuarii TaxID=3020909 RepID=UPI0024DE99C3|nr:MarR family transcriptional regulator [Parerythrobacter aestuarii]
MTSQPIRLDTLPGYALRRAANAMMAELGERLAPMGLRISDVTAMILISTGSDVTASDLARMLDIKRTNMVPLLKRLEDADLVHRRALDGKSQAIDLTEAGSKVLEQAQAEIETFEAGLLQRVPEEHREHLLPALQALYHAA